MKNVFLGLKMSIQAKLLGFFFIVFTSLTAVILSLNHHNEKAFVERVIGDEVHEMVEQYFDSVNTLMISGAMDQREVLRNKALKRKNIKSARILRSQSVVDLFGEGYSHEKAQNELEEKALKGFSYSGIVNKNGERELTVITPYKAQENFRGTNCIECHQVPEGTVLGAVAITYSLSEMDKELSQNLWKSGRVIVLIFLGILLLVAFILKFTIINPIKRTSALLKTVSLQLDLRLRAVDGKRKDEIGEMSKGFDQLMATLQETVGEVGLVAEQLLSHSEDIAKKSESSEQKISLQSAETEHVASAVHEMNETSKLVYGHTEETRKASEVTDRATENGVKHAWAANENIRELENQIEYVGKEIESLKELGNGIDQILKMINEVAMKTTLLSFNASIEAARAGEHGRGFTVVAEEIGELANQTKNSTKSIGEQTKQLKEKMDQTARLMQETIEKAKVGQRGVNETTETLDIIAHEIKKVKSMAESISTAAKEQSDASESINQSLSVITDLTTSNRAEASELKIVGLRLGDTSAKLHQLMQKFKVK